MALVTAGEINAMGMLYEKYKMPLYAYFRKATMGDYHASEDLVQTVFYRAIKYKSSFTGQGSFAKWLFRIAHNTFLDYRKKINGTVEYKSDILKELPLHPDDTDETTDNGEKLEVLRKALGKLTDSERELVILCKIECLRYNDVADILGISEGNVKIRMFRALNNLREIFMNIENFRYEKKGS